MYILTKGVVHLLRFLILEDPTPALAPSNDDDDDENDDDDTDELDWGRRPDLESSTMTAASCACTAWLVNNKSLLSSTTLGLSFELESEPEPELELEPGLELE